MFDISITSNFKQLERKLSRLVSDQIPFVRATGATELAKLVQGAEQENFSKVLDRPTPFTQRSVGVIGARKGTGEAIVFMKDIAAQYLLPYEFGGRNKLNSKALLKPVDLATNQYGNLPKTKLRQLLARSDVFVGPVKTKSGAIINGVWQRPSAQAAGSSKGRQGRQPARSNTTGHLVLLIRFDDAHPVTQHLGWFRLAKSVVDENYRRVFGQALARALASSR